MSHDTTLAIEVDALLIYKYVDIQSLNYYYYYYYYYHDKNRVS